MARSWALHYYGPGCVRLAPSLCPLEIVYRQRSKICSFVMTFAYGYEVEVFNVKKFRAENSPLYWHKKGSDDIKIKPQVEYVLFCDLWGLSSLLSHKGNHLAFSKTLVFFFLLESSFFESFLGKEMWKNEAGDLRIALMTTMYWLKQKAPELSLPVNGRWSTDGQEPWNAKQSSIHVWLLLSSASPQNLSAARWLCTHQGHTFQSSAPSGNLIKDIN